MKQIPFFRTLISHSCWLVLLPGIFWSMFAMAQAEQVESDYVLATGDVVEIRVYGESDLSMKLSIPASGMVEYSFVGDVQLADKTVNQVEEELYQLLLGDYLLEPRVSVSISGYRNIYVYGSVNRSGSFAWQPGLTVRKAITLAGGLRERASGSKWYLVAEGAKESERRKVNQDSLVQPGESLTIEESFF